MGGSVRAWDFAGTLLDTFQLPAPVTALHACVDGMLLGKAGGEVVAMRFVAEGLVEESEPLRFNALEPATSFEGRPAELLEEPLRWGTPRISSRVTPSRRPVPVDSSFVVRSGGSTNPGRARDKNCDSLHIGKRVLVVADGQDDLPGAELASTVVVSALAALDFGSVDDPIQALRGAVHDTSDQLRNMIDRRRELEGMSTTMTAMLFTGEKVAVAYIGDVRGYVLRRNALTQLTKDETVAERLVEQRRILREYAHQHDGRWQTTRVLGRDEVEPICSVHDVLDADRYVICSRGLWGIVSTPEIRKIVKFFKDPGEAAQQLVGLARQHGGKENITVIVADASSKVLPGSAAKV